MAANAQVCFSCSDNFIVNNKSIDCKYCQKVFHAGCAKVKDSYYKFINDSKNVYWFCDECIKIIPSKLTQSVSTADTKTIQQKIEKLTLRTEEISETTKECLEHLSGKLFAYKSNNNNMSNWSDIVKKKNNPLLVIKPKNSAQNSNETKKEITEKVNIENIDVAVRKLKHAGQGSIQIECEDENSLKRIQDVATASLADNYNVAISEFKRPNILIVGVDEKYLSSQEIFMDKLKSKVKDVGDSEMRFIKKYIPKNKKNFSVLVEVSAETFKYFMTQKRLYLGWDSYPIFEYVNVLRCFKCCRYGHKAEKCRNKEYVCPKCSGSHRSWECNSTNLCCTNCKHANQVLNMSDIQFNHSIFDKECTVYKREVEKNRNKVKYI